MNLAALAVLCAFLVSGCAGTRAGVKYDSSKLAGAANGTYQAIKDIVDNPLPPPPTYVVVPSVQATDQTLTVKTEKTYTTIEK